MIVGWIRSSIEARVRSTVTFISDSHKLWDNLKKRFSVGYKVQVHFLEEQLARCRQDGQSVMDYYCRLAKLWEELDMYKPLPPCSCSAAAVYEKDREEEKVHQFLMGLDEVRFGGVCQEVIASDAPVDLGEAYAKVIREEQQLTSTKDREAQQSVVGFSAKKDLSDINNASGSTKRAPCTHCGRKGNVINQIVGSWLDSPIGGMKDLHLEITEQFVVAVEELLLLIGKMALAYKTCHHLQCLAVSRIR